MNPLLHAAETLAVMAGAVGFILLCGYGFGAVIDAIYQHCEEPDPRPRLSLPDDPEVDFDAALDSLNRDPRHRVPTGPAFDQKVAPTRRDSLGA